MSQLLDFTPTGTQELDPTASAEILARAVAGRVKVRVEADETSSRVCTGYLLDGENGTLHFISSDSEEQAPTLPTTALLLVSFTVEKRKYEFISRCMETSASPPGEAVPIAYPDRVAVVDRRRSRRRFVADTTIVLTAMRETGSATWRATLLNLSADGVACLASEDDFADLNKGDILRARFAVGSPLLTFHLTGRLVNRTTAGSPGQVVLGLEFTDDEECSPERDRLRKAIKTAARLRTSDQLS